MFWWRNNKISSGHGIQAVIQTHKSVNEWRIRMYRPTYMDPRIKCVIGRPRIKALLGKQASPTMPRGLNEGNVDRGVCPGFWMSTYGASLAKAPETSLKYDKWGRFWIWSIISRISLVETVDRRNQQTEALVKNAKFWKSPYVIKHLHTYTLHFIYMVGEI